MSEKLLRLQKEKHEAFAKFREVFPARKLRCHSSIYSPTGAQSLLCRATQQLLAAEEAEKRRKEEELRKQREAAVAAGFLPPHQAMPGVGASLLARLPMFTEISPLLPAHVAFHFFTT